MSDTRLRSWLPFAAALLLCALVIGPGVGVYTEIATGDHGRDLYVAEAALRGELPYRDYIWQYGPLMPFYYAAFLALFGASAASLTIGAAVLRAGTALVVYAILRRTTTPIIAVLGCWWLLLFQRSFAHTFSHAGATASLALLTWMLLRYVDEHRPRDLLLGCGVVFVLLLQKLNFGVIGLASLAGAAGLVEWRTGGEGRRNRTLALLAVPFAALLAAAVYALMLWDLPEYAVRQSLPYLPSDRVQSLGIGEGLVELTKLYASSLSSDPHTIVGSLVILGGLAVWLPSLRASDPLESQAGRALLVAGALYAMSLHEFVLSGFPYRLRWSDLFATLLTALLADRLCRALPPRGATALVSGLALFCAVFSVRGWVAIAEQRGPEHFLEHERLRVYTPNGEDWRDVVMRTTAYLEANVAASERFFALPYEPLYYVLTGQPTPTRSLMLFEFIDPGEPQQRDIIADLERENVRWIVMGSRAWASKEIGMGSFGETHAALLAAWIDEHFELVEEIGEQRGSARWIRGHTTRIYRRRD